MVYVLHKSPVCYEVALKEMHIRPSRFCELLELKQFLCYADTFRDVPADCANKRAVRRIYYML